MAHGLEVRSPLLDHEVVELSLRDRSGRQDPRRDREADPPEARGDASAAGGRGGQEDAASRRPCARGSADRSGLSSSGRCCAKTRSWRRSSASLSCAAWSRSTSPGRGTTARSSGACSRSRRGRRGTGAPRDRRGPAAVEALAPRVLVRAPGRARHPAAGHRRAGLSRVLLSRRDERDPARAASSARRGRRTPAGSTSPRSRTTSGSRSTPPSTSAGGPRAPSRAPEQFGVWAFSRVGPFLAARAPRSRRSSESPPSG